MSNTAGTVYYYYEYMFSIYKLQYKLRLFLDSFLSLQDRYIYRQLFLTADNEKKSFLLKSEAISFFSTAGIPSVLLEEVYKMLLRWFFFLM
jgi:hypothetical protein